ncbi:MAG: hypothetical protein Q4D78_10450 [Neisseria zoodegmatis]|uniref:hypothetical protein n=1 Tax=Neisseria zoodegmatis TaxID=326523 RepID=UPI0026F23962|nr:hypothetical protein [Neisseria zoodegmatis]MDO5070588.1 hypothetical protein [Neisseria zoodegmatis]
MSAPYLLTPQPYRGLAVFTAVVGTLLLWRYVSAESVAAFAAVILLFLGALVAIAAVVLALRRRDSAIVIQGLLLMLWQIGFPLAWMAKIGQQAV